MCGFKFNGFLLISVSKIVFFFLKLNVVPAKEEQEQGEKEKEKIVTATKKGSAVLDQFLSDQIKSEYHVLQIVSLLAVFYLDHLTPTVRIKHNLLKWFS